MEIVVLLDREEQPQSALHVWPWSYGVVVHVHKPSTHVLTPPKLGALREVARDNIFSDGYIGGGGGFRLHLTLNINPLCLKLRSTK